MRMEAFFLTASSGNMINDMGYTRPSMRNIHPIFYVCTHTGSMNRTLKMVDRFEKKATLRFRTHVEGHLKVLVSRPQSSSTDSWWNYFGVSVCEP